MTALGVAMVGFGILLVASGVKDLDPREVTLAILTGRPLPRHAGADTWPNGQPKGSGPRGGGIAGVPGSGEQSTLPPNSTGAGGAGGGNGGW